ncbi:MAG: hypothetical protein AAB593_01120 [Patescibacteria group bacterium]
MENFNDKQNNEQEKIEDIKKDYKIETMSDNIVDESQDEQIDTDAKLEKKPLYDNIGSIGSIPDEIIPEQIENNENNERDLSKNIIREEDGIINSEQNKFRRLASFIIGFGSVLIIGLIVIAIVYIFSGNGNDITPEQEKVPITEEIDNKAENTEIKFEQPLFPIDQNLTVNIEDNMTRIDFLSQLREIINQSTDLSEQGDVINLYLTNNNEKLSLNKLASLLNINEIELDSYFNTDNYTLFYYDSLNGARFGLAIEVIKDSLIKDYFNKIENIILSLNNQIFSEYTGNILSKSKTQGFNNSIYQGVDIRFINFDNYISIDYGFKNNIFIVAGSMETMHEVIDRINLMENAK